MNATIRTFDTLLSSHIHMKVCTPPYQSVSDLSLWGQPLTWDNVFCILSLIICFNYYRLIVRFSPSCNIIDGCTTMASEDFSRQALLHFFRKSNYLKRP